MNIDTFQVKILLPNIVIKPLDYFIKGKNIPAIGSFVKVPFRNKETIGIVYSYDIDKELEQSKIKEATLIDNLPPLKKDLLEFADFFCKYNLATPGQILKLIIPNPYLIEESKRKEQVFSLANISLVTLSDEQKEASDKIIQSIKDKKHNVILLEGVTGSGKTEVYFEAIADILKSSNDQVLILLPEIALTSQSSNRFEQRFGFKAHSWHSSMTKKERRETWQDIIEGKARVVIGARSALFLPFKSLSFVVVDEEHDASYKQEEGIIYQARDMAIARSFFEKSTILLASATPSFETMHNVLSGKYEHIKLSTRFNINQMPIVKIIDMKKASLKKDCYIHPDLEKEISITLANQKQSMLFLNRRGYAPLTICKSCGYRVTCPRCSVFMVHHKKKGKDNLECHYCGYRQKYPEKCSACNEDGTFIDFGPGVEKIEKEVHKLFPEAKVIILTRDTISSHKEVEEFIAKIKNKEVDIIIGTQIIAKGHHFPDLDLVGVIDADIGLKGGDLRAAERAYQLLYQVSGRAGREKTLGRVVIQTYYPDNSVLEALKNYKKDEFVNLELTSRQEALMPPFAKLASIIISGKKEEKVKECADNLVKIAPVDKNIFILGPVQSSIVRIRNNYRYRILIKTSKNINLQKYISFLLEQFNAKYGKTYNVLRIKVDIDPYNFM